MYQCIYVYIIIIVVHVHGNNDDFFHYHSWTNNIVVAFGTILSFLTQLHTVNGVVCVVRPFCR